VERQIVIKNLPKALQVVKEMKLSSDEWTGEYRDAARSTIATILKQQMEQQVAGHLSWAYQRGIPDRRKGSYGRRILTELGDTMLSIPRTRHFNPRGIIAAYARRVREIDHLILACFLLGLDFCLATSESGAAWNRFLTDLMRRGLAAPDIICADGGQGLISILPEVFPGVPLQRCWAHKVRNILDKVRRKKQKSVKRGLTKIYLAKNLHEAQTAAARWARLWIDTYPKAVKCLHDDLEDLLTCFQFDDPDFRKAIRTTNAIERRFREVRRRTRPMGVFSNRTSVERILYAVLMYENINQGAYPVFVLTQNT